MLCIRSGQFFVFLENLFLQPISEKYRPIKHVLEKKIFLDQPFPAEMGFKFRFFKIPPGPSIVEEWKLCVIPEKNRMGSVITNLKKKYWNLTELLAENFFFIENGFIANFSQISIFFKFWRFSFFYFTLVGFWKIEI